MQQRQDFINDGFGWKCLRCDNELSISKPEEEKSRLMQEGEAESKNPQLSNSALAKWFDAAQTTLICPRCGITELIDIA